MIVVADTSVLINLALVGHEALLAALFREVVAPPAVEKEFQRLAASSGRFSGLALPAWVRVRAHGVLPLAIANDPALDSGEAQALALALEISADAILLDEAHGRAVALELGLVPIGVLGILVRAKQKMHLPSVAPVLEALRTRANFRVSDDLIFEVLRLAGEGS